MEQKDNLTLGSLFDGSGGFPLGGLISGITPVWASEVEPFPIRVTTKRMPWMRHLGDVSKINGADLEPVDIISFGSPCQDMSVAGKRDGLDGSRSSLFYEAIRIVKEMRKKTNGQYPRFIVWENVPGAFSSNKGDDFRAVLTSVASVKGSYVIPEPPKGKWAGAGELVGDDFSIAWRTLDAQYWGVPQRRKRIYLVADFRDKCAGKILFESEGLSGYTPQGFKSWQGTSGTSSEGFGEAGRLCLNDQGGERMDVTEDITCTLRAESHHPPIVFENHSQDTRYRDSGDTAPTVAATYGTGGNNQPFVLESPKAYGICSKESNSMKSDNPNSGFYEAETSRTLDGNGGNPTCNQGGIAVVQDTHAFHINQRMEGIDLGDKAGALMASQSDQMQTFVLQGSMIGRDDKNGPQGNGVNEDVSFTLNTADRHAVVYGLDRASFNSGEKAQFGFVVEEEKAPTMMAKGPGAVAYPVYCTSKNTYHTSADVDVAGTLVATDYKDPPIINDVKTVSGKDVFGTLAASMGEKLWLGNQEAFSGDYHILEPEYIVRRLTPTECARLQGFPDWWCADLGTHLPSEEELSWWAEVFETHRKIMGTSSKPKTKKQIFKWLQNPHSDSAEYKMWGNGVALPNVCFVLSGIVYYAQNSEENTAL